MSHETENVEFLPTTTINTQSLLAEMSDSENKENNSEMVETLAPFNVPNVIDPDSSHVETTEEQIAKASEDSLTKSDSADRDEDDDNSSTRSEAPVLNDDREIMDCGDEHDHITLPDSSSSTMNTDVVATNDLNDDPAISTELPPEQIAQQGCKDYSLEEVEDAEQFIDDALAQLNEKSNSMNDSEPCAETPPLVPENEITHHKQEERRRRKLRKSG